MPSSLRDFVRYEELLRKWLGMHDNATEDAQILQLMGGVMDALEPRLGSSSPQAGPAFSQDPSAKTDRFYRLDIRGITGRVFSWGVDINLPPQFRRF